MTTLRKINQSKYSTLSTWLKWTNQHETRALAVENPGWFESIESCLTSFQRYVLHRFCNTLLSPTAVLTGFQGMGRKTYLLGLLGLLLISCKCAFVLFAWEVVSFASTVVVLNNFYVHETFTFGAMYMKANDPYVRCSEKGLIRFIFNARIFNVWVIRKID